MKRTEVVKALWQYIKANDLQDPSNRQHIILDSKLETSCVFFIESATIKRWSYFAGRSILCWWLRPYVTIAASRRIFGWCHTYYDDDAKHFKVFLYEDLVTK